jgi:hypothetical protein
LLKSKYIGDGRRAARYLVDDANVLAVWLSGPFELERVSPTSDLHMAVLVKSGRGNYYHHQLPHFSEVGRRLEIAYFPLAYLQSILDKGYSEWADVSDLHKLSDIEILYEKDGVLSAIRRRVAEVKPTRLFVGRQMGALGAECALTERLLDIGRIEDSIVSSRSVMISSLMLLMLAARGRTFSKLSHLYPEFRSHSPSDQVETFEVVHGVRAHSREEAEKRVSAAKNLVKHLMERQGI